MLGKNFRTDWNAVKKSERREKGRERKKEDYRGKSLIQSRAFESIIFTAQTCGRLGNEYNFKCGMKYFLLELLDAFLSRIFLPNEIFSQLSAFAGGNVKILVLMKSVNEGFHECSRIMIQK